MDRIARAKHFISLEADAVRDLDAVLDEKFEHAIDLLLDCSGRVVVTGMGKAGLIARKTGATLASTGTPSFYVHPGEAIHGDLGMITEHDVIIAFSNSGQTEEILRIIPYIKHVKAPLIGITANGESELAKQSDALLKLKIDKEACPLNLAPTSSTTAMLALGDILALVLLEARGFKPEDYAIFHPGGSLGKKLLTRVSDVMHSGDDNPVVPEEMPLREAILVMSQKRLAATSVVDAEGKLAGFFTDGDLRRSLADGRFDVDAPISTVMTRNPKSVSPTIMAVKALEILRNHKIITLPVVSEDEKPVGMVHFHDITRAGIS